MRTSTRSLSNRASGYAPQGRSGFQVPRAANSNFRGVRGVGATQIPASPAPSGLAALENQIAQRLGFARGRNDPAWRNAKSLVRRGKLGLNALEGLLDAVAENLAQVPIRNYVRSFGNCTYASGNSPAVGRPEWSGIAPQCLQGQSNGGLQPHNGPIRQQEINTGFAQYVGADTNPALPGPWQIVENVSVAGKSLGHYLGTILAGNALSPLTMVDPLLVTRPLQAQSIAPPRSIPHWVLPRIDYRLGVLTREANFRTNGNPLPRPVASPRPRNTTQIEITPRGVSVSPAKWAKPKPPTREKKAVITSGLAGAAMNAVTETSDVVDALYNALPERITKREFARRGGKPPILQDKIALLFRYWNEINVNTAVQNIVLNQIEDAVIGRTSRAANRINRHMGGRPVGITFGPAL